MEAMSYFDYDNPILEFFINVEKLVKTVAIYVIVVHFAVKYW